METRLVETTADGSQTIRVVGAGITYHSHHGAVQESAHVFIKAGLETRLHAGGPQHVLEMGLGTGLNLLMTAQRLMNTGLSVQYTALEKHPLQPAEYQVLSYAVPLNWPEADGVLQGIHQSPWGPWNPLTEALRYRKLHTGLEDWVPDANFDVIYYDAFAPSAQPELWTEPVFAKLFGCARSGAILVTYCSKGVVRRAMQAAGWQVHKLPGPKGKREMVVAHKA